MLPRPSGIVRYIFVAVLIIFALYAFSSNTYDLRSSAFSQVSSAGKFNLFENAAANGQARDTRPKQVPVGDVPNDDSTESSEKDDSTDSNSGDKQTTAQPEHHPIDKLIFDAQNRFAALVSKRTKTVEDAAQAYRKRRGRHPPPGFDEWFQYAQSNSALIVEDFFDQIYDDLQPFWGLDPAVLRRESWDFEMVINVRDGNATADSNWFWTKIWLEMIKTFDHLLPDMDIPLNAMDEPRMIVSHEEIANYMDKAAGTVNLPGAKKVISAFQKLPLPGKGEPDLKTRKKDWESTNPFWKLVRRGCPKDSLARTTQLQDSFDQAPTIRSKNTEAHTYQGYVSNYTLSVDVCHQPDLQGLSGVLIHPLSTSTTKVLFPLFGGSKLSVNNEILLPAPMYYNEEERFTGGGEVGVPWAEKTDGVMWRGVATGGENTVDNWKGFQRHRFVAMNNATTLARVESGDEDPENFALPDKNVVSAQRKGKLSEWVQKWANVSLVDLNCSPVGEEGHCNYTDHYFEPQSGIPMSAQFDYKYLPDIDGNSFSGRYRGFLKSSAVPIKSTLWKEWHDSRLVAWKHFVPMDNRFGDYYGIMEYFLGSDEVTAHDSAGEKIADEGQEWADKVLRKEDMQIYVYRLLLEYARILDDRRESMGWVADVLKDSSLQSKWKLWWG